MMYQVLYNFLLERNYGRLHKQRRHAMAEYYRRARQGYSVTVKTHQEHPYHRQQELLKVARKSRGRES